MNTPQYGQYAQYAPRQERCPRHPDQYAVGYCKRCNRPACGQCAIPTEVSILCRECHRENQRAARSFTTFGSGNSRASGGSGIAGTLRTYPVVSALTIINVLMWLIGLATGGQNSLVEPLGYMPLVVVTEPWRLLTAAFLHAGFFHLFFNMIMLAVMGRLLERTMGHGRFTALYLLSAIGGNLFVGIWALIVPSSVWAYTVGASGALYGIMGALLVSMKQLNLPTTSLAVLIGINLIYGLLMPGVSWEAHVGGLGFGALACTAFVWAAKASRKTFGRTNTRNAVLAGGAVLVVEILVLVATDLVLMGQYPFL